MWQTLAVGQQSAAREHKFAFCQLDSLQQGGFTSVGYQKTVSRVPSDITVAGTTQRVHSTAITAELALDGRHPQTRTVTVHWFTDGAAWRWSLDASAVRAYQRGQCPQ